jgi:hypothetical protein
MTTSSVSGTSRSSRQAGEFKGSLLRIGWLVVEVSGGSLRVGMIVVAPQ